MSRRQKFPLLMVISPIPDARTTPLKTKKRGSTTTFEGWPEIKKGQGWATKFVRHQTTAFEVTTQKAVADLRVWRPKKTIAF